MLTSLITGAFALAGVTLGALLEPVKAKVAARQRLRDDRALRCAEVIESASAARSAILALFRHTRIEQRPSQAILADFENRYWEARVELKRAVLGLRLVAPDELINDAELVLDSDFQLRRHWFDAVPAERNSSRVELSQALKQNESTALRFADSARRHVGRG